MKVPTLPADVITHGETFGLRGHHFWPQLSHRQVVDAIDSLKKKHQENYDRVYVSKNYIYLLNIPST